MACPVCFSPVEPSIRESLNIGILVLLGATGGVLACFARFFFTLARRSRAAAHLVQHTGNVAAGFPPPPKAPEGLAEARVPARFAGEGFSGPAVGLKADATS